jgi:hypothetical protein
MAITHEATRITLTYNQSQMVVDQHGATALSLKMPTLAGQEARELLYSHEMALDVVKPLGSHFMMPVGYDCRGGFEHGPARRSYARRGVTQQMSTGQHLSLYLGTGGDGGYTRRDILLGNTSARIDTEVRFGEEPRRTSMGERICVGLGGASLGDVCIGSQPIEKVLGCDALNRLDSGESVFWPGFSDSVIIRFPRQDQPDGGGNGGISIAARASVGDVPIGPDGQGMVFWREKTSADSSPLGYLCAEPVVGVTQRDGELLGDGLHIIQPYQYATFGLAIMVAGPPRIP